MDDFSFINSLIYYGVIFVIFACLWHYGVPKPVKKAIKNIIRKIIYYGIKAKKSKEKQKPEPITERKPEVKEFNWEDTLNDSKK